MSYLVLGLGAFLSLCGAIAIYTGYGIIQVERGWASVIAGSMAFSCGIVTLALGLILHRLSRIHGVLKSGQGTTPPHEMAWRTDYERSPDFAPESSIAPDAVPPIVAAPAPRSWPQRPMRSNLAAARNFLKSRGTVLPTARGTSETDYSPQEVPPLSRDGFKTLAEPPFEPGFARPAGMAETMPEDEAQTRPAFAPADERPAEHAWRTDSEPSLFDEVTGDETEEAPSSRPVLEMQGTSGEAGAPAEVSWPAENTSIEAIFEEELFLELNPEPDSRTGAAEWLRDSIEPATLDAEPPVETRTAYHTEPPLEAPVTGEGQEELAIVGQYQSAGTSYVMYSDGSIEARTEHAVFHFKSMAELKTFMDSEAQNSKE